MKARHLLPLLALALGHSLQAQTFDKGSYYSQADGLTGSQLRSALCSIIQDHTERQYSDLWEDFRSTDARSDGKVWDMYSGVTDFTFGDDQAGNYTAEGDVYNREHSFPKSWFNDATPMYTDLYHLYPTDGYVNGRRSNYCFGDVKTVSYASSGSFSILGTPSDAMTQNGCTESVVFEPNDIYKGDFARTYFYMLTAYADRTSSWSCGMLADGDFSTWARIMLLDWAEGDTVSQKETDRIEAVYAIQGNRNPFIDFPGLEHYVWGEWQDSTFSVTAYRNPLHYLASTEEDTDTDVDTDDVTDLDADSYVLVTAEPDTWEGQYLIAYRTDDYVYVFDGSLETLDASGNHIDTTESSSGVITATASLDASSFLIEAQGDAYSIRSVTTGTYIGCTASKNTISTTDTYEDSYANTLSFQDGVATITGSSDRVLQFNSSSGTGNDRFRYYLGTQKDISLYLRVSGTENAIQSVTTDASTTADQHWYDLSGRRLTSRPTHRGIYIHNGRKVAL